MTRSAALVRIGVSSGRSLLPWVAVLLASATMAYAMTSAVAGGSLVRNEQPDVQVAVSAGDATGGAALEPPTTSESVASANRGRSLVTEPCPGIGNGPIHVGVDWWIVAESQKMACEHVGS